MDIDDLLLNDFRKFGGGTNSNIWEGVEDHVIQTPENELNFQSSGIIDERPLGISTGPGTRSLHLTSSTISPSKRSSREPELDEGNEFNLEDDFGAGDFHLKSPTISPSKRSSHEPELDPAHELNLGSDLNLGNGFGGHQLTTRIAQLRRDLGAKGAELDTAKEQLAKIVGHHQMLKSEVAEKDIKQQMAKVRNKRRIVDAQLAELYQKNESLQTVVRRQRRAMKEAEFDSKEYIEEYEDIKQRHRKQKIQEKELRATAANYDKQKRILNRKVAKLKRKLQSVRQRKQAKERSPNPKSSPASAMLPMQSDLFSTQRSMLLEKEKSVKQAMNRKTKRLKQKLTAQDADIKNWERTEAEINASIEQMDAQIVSSKALIDRLLRQHISLQILKDEQLESSQSSETGSDRDTRKGAKLERRDYRRGKKGLKKSAHKPSPSTLKTTKPTNNKGSPIQFRHKQYRSPSGPERRSGSESESSVKSVKSKRRTNALR